MIYEGIDTSTILSVPDSVKFYRIAHYDTSGNPIYSQLNNEMIIIGKEMGLANFFRIDSFPLVLQPITLIGNLSPAAGYISLTNEMIFDHQPGDEIQYHDQYYMLEGPPFLNYLNYIKHIFLERTDTEDSIFYIVERITYETDSNVLIQDTIILKYKRNKTIAEIPFDKLNQDQALVISSFYAADYCEFNLWTYSLKPQYLIYCAEDNCWGSFDIPGPPPDEETTYVCGLGLYLDRSSISMPPPTGYSYMKKIIYFKKDGIECGEEIIVDVNEPTVLSPKFKVYPNPAQDRLFFRTEMNGSGIIQICDINGRNLRKLSVEGQMTTIDISGLSDGIYLIKFFSESSVEVRKIIVER